MAKRRTVIEVIASTALTVDLPIDYGEDLAAGLETVLGDLEGVRYVAIEEIGEVTTGEGISGSKCMPA